MEAIVYGGWSISSVLLLIFLECLAGRPMTYDGTIRWIGRGPRVSSDLLDWYSLSHVLHGFIGYGLWVAWSAFPWTAGLLAAVWTECAWELLENSPWVIRRYRRCTVADEYAGDTIVNSVSDVFCMLVGFVLAWAIPGWGTVGLGIVMELLALWAIRDNLTLNVVMLIYPVPAIRRWQQEW